MGLRKAGGNWVEGNRFVSGLVEDWWRARHSHGFVPFGRRLN